MSDKAWKAFERRIAKSLGTVRTPLSGGASRHTTSDTLHPDLYVECKTRRSSATCSWFDVIRFWAKKEKKVPVMALHRFRSHTTLAVIDWKLFVQLWYCFIEIAVEHGWPEGQHFIEECQREIEKKGLAHD